MLKRLRRILLALLALIAVAILGPLAYIEETCQPATEAASATKAAIALPPIQEKGYRRPLDNTYFTFPEWYIVYSFGILAASLISPAKAILVICTTSSASGGASAPSTGRCRQVRSRASM